MSPRRRASRTSASAVLGGDGVAEGAAVVGAGVDASPVVGDRRRFPAARSEGTV
ncbi:hypothetical protein KSK32_32305 [Micromonospora sp. WMMB482]|uniref:hypothetical protein n=1 Tax=Micromonospora sp. WMMB482 TaxID=2849653 RepID=UPI001C24BACF|nr:hypothetical protein [Micromonospora sp. WMMB482]MBU8861875.1 hypothetical protein [Micromonospora sp. WMMB482]